MNTTKIMLAAAGLLFGLTLYAVFVPSPTFAQDCSTYDAVLAKVRENKLQFYEIPADRLSKVVKDVEATTGDDYGTVSRGFFLFLPGLLSVGFEHEGCLYAPIHIPRPHEAGA